MENKLEAIDLLQRFSPKVLWHFTGYGKNDLDAYRILSLIVGGRTLKLTEHPESVIMRDGETRWIYPYSCMCDIPFRDLRIHTLRYGMFGIAFNKNKAITSGEFNPVLYAHKNNPIFNYATQVLPQIDKMIESNPILEQALTRYLALLGTFIKTGDLTAPALPGNIAKDREQNSNFYYEREWRSVKEWKFIHSDVEAIMVPKNIFKDARVLLHANGFEGIPIIPSEMVELL